MFEMSAALIIGLVLVVIAAVGVCLCCKYADYICGNNTTTVVHTQPSYAYPQNSYSGYPYQPPPPGPIIYETHSPASDFAFGMAAGYATSHLGAHMYPSHCDAVHVDVMPPAVHETVIHHYDVNTDNAAPTYNDSAPSVDYTATESYTYDDSCTNDCYGDSGGGDYD